MTQDNNTIQENSITKAEQTMKLYRQGLRWEAYKSYQEDELASNPSMTMLQFIGKMETVIRDEDAMEKCYSIKLACD